MKTLQYHINIQATRAKVWVTMLDDKTYREWVHVSWPNSFYLGEWKEGHQIRFVSEDGSGTLAILDEIRPNVVVAARHIAILNTGGIEDTTTDLAKGWIGTKERYDFDEKNGVTSLTVTITTREEWQPMFDEGWPGALEKLREISERK